jgi:hypothetical protein
MCNGEGKYFLWDGYWIIYYYIHKHEASDSKRYNRMNFHLFKLIWFDRIVQQTGQDVDSRFPFTVCFLHPFVRRTCDMVQPPTYPTAITEDRHNRALTFI